jgi:hypothetical protein
LWLVKEAGHFQAQGGHLFHRRRGDLLFPVHYILFVSFVPFAAKFSEETA